MYHMMYRQMVILPGFCAGNLPYILPFLLGFFDGFSADGDEVMDGLPDRHVM